MDEPLPAIESLPPTEEAKPSEPDESTLAVEYALEQQQEVPARSLLNALLKQAGGFQNFVKKFVSDLEKSSPGSTPNMKAHMFILSLMKEAGEEEDRNRKKPEDMSDEELEFSIVQAMLNNVEELKKHGRKFMLHKNYCPVCERLPPWRFKQTPAYRRKNTPPAKPESS